MVSAVVKVLACTLSTALRVVGLIPICTLGVIHRLLFWVRVYFVFVSCVFINSLTTQACPSCENCLFKQVKLLNNPTSTRSTIFLKFCFFLNILFICFFFHFGVPSVTPFTKHSLLYRLVTKCVNSLFPSI